MELSLLPLAFSPSLTVASRLLHSCSIEDKTPRFVGETILHSQEFPERSTELYREEKGEEGGRSDKERRGGVKRGESNLASNQFAKCSP